MKGLVRWMAVLLAVSAPAFAQAPPVEGEALAARFPDPLVSYRTPAFEPGREDFTSNAELRTLLLALAADPANAGRVDTIDIGSSQAGVPLLALRFSRPPAGAPHPVVLLVGQQHGDEPAGAEALLVIAQELAHGGRLAALLDRLDIVILARANPDGAALRRRGSASGLDVNRDHLLLRTPEAQAQARLVRELEPIVVVDAHEYGAIGLYPAKFDAVRRADLLFQYAMVANLAPLVTRAAEEWFRLPLLQALKAQGLSSEWYHTNSADPADRRITMGSAQPDSARNVNGLRNAISILIESRGADLGRAHLLRRVHTQVVAIESVLKSAAARADDLRRLRRFVDADLAARACSGEVVVEAAATPSEYTLTMLDPRSGADKPVTVAWESALALTPLRKRARPCGYWLGADQTDAVLRLRGLGVRVQRIDAPGELQGEVYRGTERGTERETAPESVRETTAPRVALAPAVIDARVGSYYVGLDQPLANLVVAALEPDTAHSFAAHRIVDTAGAAARVLRRPLLVKMSALP